MRGALHTRGSPVACFDCHSRAFPELRLFQKQQKLKPPVLKPGAGDDSIRGEKGDDTISGGTGNDIIDGGAGADVLQGDEGDDILIGGAGNDSLYAGLGHDTLTGGVGNNTFAPLDSSPQEIFAYSRVGTSLRVNVSGEIRSQPIVTNSAAYYLNGKILTDLLLTKDDLVDRNLVI